MGASELSGDGQESERTVRAPPLHFLVLALRERFSGTVHAVVEGEDQENLVLFHKGAPAKVRLARPVLTLESVLARMGAAASIDLADCAREAMESGLMLGSMLVVRGIVTAQQLEDALRVQVQEKVAYLLGLSNRMHFRMRPGVNLLEEYGGPETTAIEPVGMLLYGARLAASVDVVDAHVAQLAGLRLTLRHDAQAGRLRTQGDEEAVVRLLGEGAHTVGSLVDHGLDGRAIKNVVFTLSSAQFLARADDSPTSAVGVSARASSTAVRSTISSPNIRAQSSPSLGTPSLRSMPSSPGMRIPESGGRAASLPPGASMPPQSGRTVSHPPRDRSSLRPEVRQSRLSKDELTSKRPHPSLPSLPSASQATIPPSTPHTTGLRPRDSQPDSDPVPRSTPPAPRSAPFGPGAPSRRVPTAAESFDQASHSLRLHDLERADRHIKEALAQEPHNPDYKATQAYINATKGAAPGSPPWSEGVALLGKLIANNADCELAYYYRARLYKSVRKMDEAYADFEMCVSLNPANLHAADELKARSGNARSNLKRKTPDAKQSGMLSWLKKNKT
jgi:hypothetical protein